VGRLPPPPPPGFDTNPPGWGGPRGRVGAGGGGGGGGWAAAPPPFYPRTPHVIGGVVRVVPSYSIEGQFWGRVFIRQVAFA
jgi:hypothetical protein